METDSVFTYSPPDQHVTCADFLEQRGLFDGDGVRILIKRPKTTDELQRFLLGGERVTSVPSAQQRGRVHGGTQSGKSLAEGTQQYALTVTATAINHPKQVQIRLQQWSREQTPQILRAMTVGRHEMKQVPGLSDQIIVVRRIQRDLIGVVGHRVIGSDALHMSVHAIKGKVGELHSVQDPAGKFAALDLQLEVPCQIHVFHAGDVIFILNACDAFHEFSSLFSPLSSTSRTYKVSLSSPISMLPVR